jgi:hypothetical protein
MAGKSSTLRAVALMVAAALGLHELRYLIGYGGDTGSALAAQGHGYLSFAGLPVAVLLGAAAVGLLRAMVRAHRIGVAARDEMPFGVLWLSVALCLALIYCSQEFLEGLLAHGHPSGVVAGLLAQGGWTAFPLALVIGLGVALLLRGADAAIAAAARRARCPRPAAGAVSPRPALPPLAPASSVLARNLAGRAPPLIA